MSRYDRAITVFSPHGRLLQLDYANDAVRMWGASVVGLRGKDVSILGVERRAIAKLQDPRTVNKICKIDQHITLAFSGFQADARVLVNKARLEAQSYRLTYEDAPSIEYMARFIARTQQKYTQRGGVRPFGVACLIAGVEADGTPALYQTDPRGIYSSWKANVVGGTQQKNMLEFLEKQYAAELGEDEAIKMVVRTLLKVVDSGSKNMEIAILRKGKGLVMLDEDKLSALVEAIEKEEEEKQGVTETKESTA